MREVKKAYLLFFILLCGCSLVEERTMFELISAARSGITFENQLTVTDSVNGITFEYIYNGGGLGVGDVNNDGLKDLFFAGNMVSSELYLNQGNMRFRNVTIEAQVNTDRWCTGVSIVDVNQDGWKDIYVCVAGFDTVNWTRENILFINLGNDENGIPRFENQAELMGLNDAGYSTMGVFFDYDKDDDLDLYILSNWMEGSRRSMIREISKDGSGKSTDKLYQNIGGDKFKDVSTASGIVHEGYGLGVGLCDINQDGWIDVYCANDFISNDLLYINNSDGTFSEQSAEYFKHFTHNGMGMDVADYNNDGLLDVIVLDMLPPDNKRQKLMLGSNRMTFTESIEAGYHPQFLRNTLQLNRGKFLDGRYRFSEISFLAGIYQTDWSWAPILADFNNDGWKDLLITNGFRKDVANLDYMENVIEISRFGTREANRALIKKAMSELPDINLQNFIYENGGGLTFIDVSENWGLTHKTFSNGTAVADLDNDGDLDMVFNNIDSEATLYENKLNDRAGNSTNNHYINFRFDSSVEEHQKIGLKAWLYRQGNSQFVEYSPFRGYKSTLEEELHFGAGSDAFIDSLVVEWQDGTVNKWVELECDSTYQLRKMAEKPRGKHQEQRIKKVGEVEFTDIAEVHGLSYEHNTTASQDFGVTPTLLHSLSHCGPSLSVGDVNGDGIDDVVIGGDRNHPTTIFVQDKYAMFEKKAFTMDSAFHDVGTLLFDADADGDLDLYVSSGGYSFYAGHELYQDRLYMNDGKGNFFRSEGALPKIGASGSCVIAADYDKDNDLDLFVGGRVEGRSYPLTPKSFLLENQGGTFTDRSDLLGANAGALGLVTSALWSDVNQDQKVDLLVVGEWMPVTVMVQTDTGFVDKTAAYGLQNSSGWWNSINGADLDNDGDTDYVLGNYGLNSFFKATPQKPLEIFASDFDRNGTLDPVITHYNGRDQYIVHTLSVMEELIPGIRNRFRTHTAFGESTFYNSFTAEEIEGAFHLTADNLSSIVLENLDGKAFNAHKLPVEAQFSPIFGSLIRDLNGDGLKDVLLVGNSKKEETITGYYDASYGTILLNQDEFRFESVGPAQSNFVADGDKRAMAELVLANGNSAMLVSENGGNMAMFSATDAQSQIVMKAEDDDWIMKYEIAGVEIRHELYHGNGFLSSSSRNICIPEKAQKVTITKFNGQLRKIRTNQLVTER